MGANEWSRAPGNALFPLFPPVRFSIDMATLMGDIDGMPNSHPNKVVLKCLIGAESVRVALDREGRICLPKEMADAAGIANEAVLVGLLDRFEIWSPERFEKVQASDSVMAIEAFKFME